MQAAPAAPAAPAPCPHPLPPRTSTSALRLRISSRMGPSSKSDAGVLKASRVALYLDRGEEGVGQGSGRKGRGEGGKRGAGGEREGAGCGGAAFKGGLHGQLSGGIGAWLQPTWGRARGRGEARGFDRGAPRPSAGRPAALAADGSGQLILGPRRPRRANFHPPLMRPAASCLPPVHSDEADPAGGGPAMSGRQQGGGGSRRSQRELSRAARPPLTSRLRSILSAGVKSAHLGRAMCGAQINRPAPSRHRP
jgi:hypothetical protein